MMAASSLALRSGALVLAASLIGVLPVAAQEAHSGHASQGKAADPVIAGWQAINDRMHAGMAIDYTGDPDVDFARGMIAHHRGAVAMAQLVIANGTDPEIRALAETIIAAQTEEIAFLEGWLAKHGLSGPAAACGASGARLATCPRMP